MTDSEFKAFHSCGWILFIILSGIGVVGAYSHEDYASSINWAIMMVVFVLAWLAFHRLMFSK